ncbi:MAG: HTH domain-containing protein [Candidatus Aenigmatarchaeota archaeon]
MSQTQKKILDFLKKQDWPTTTEDIAKALNISWQTAQIQLLKTICRW